MTMITLVDLMDTLGMKVFVLLTQIDVDNKIPFDNHIYWMDIHEIQPKGPFSTVAVAVKNYQETIKERKQPLKIVANILDLDSYRASRPRRHW